jgi:hypothetical protein
MPFSFVVDDRATPCGLTVELSHAGPQDVNREAEMKPPSRAGSSDMLGVISLRPLGRLPVVQDIKLSILQVLATYSLAHDCDIRVEAAKQGANNVM